MPPEQTSSLLPVEPEVSKPVPFWKRKLIWIPLLVVGLFVLFVLGSHWYVISHPELMAQPTSTSGDTSVSTSTSNQYQTITNTALGVSFDVPKDWTIEDHLKDAGWVSILDPNSLGDGVDGHSFGFVISASSNYFSTFLSPNTADHFAELQALPDGKVMDAGVTKVAGDSFQGEELTKVASVSVAGYPAIHFHNIDSMSKEWGTRDMQDGYWVRVGTNNLFLYFSSIDSAKKYTYETEASTMQHVFESIRVGPETGSSNAQGLKTITIPNLHLAIEVPSDWGRFDGAADMTTVGPQDELSSTGGSYIFIQATNAGWYSKKPPYAYGLDGTQASFDALRAMPTGTPLQDSSNSIKVTKVGNSIVGGYEAVTISQIGGPENTGSIHNDTITWVRGSGMNWYIDISDFKPDVYNLMFDQVVKSITFN